MIIFAVAEDSAILVPRPFDSEPAINERGEHFTGELVAKIGGHLMRNGEVE